MKAGKGDGTAKDDVLSPQVQHKPWLDVGKKDSPSERMFSFLCLAKPSATGHPMQHWVAEGLHGQGA